MDAVQHDGRAGDVNSTAEGSTPRREIEYGESQSLFRGGEGRLVAGEREREMC